MSEESAVPKAETKPLCRRLFCAECGQPSADLMIDRFALCMPCYEVLRYAGLELQAIVQRLESKEP